MIGADRRIIPAAEPIETPQQPLSDALVEQLAELWCEALLANLRRHPIQPSIRRAS
jgi:hypothetical protein